jgi:hypothetical protein
MTKLHIQVNQTMQFYRGQQGGSAPQRLFLSGGASIMPYTAQFFAEKLNVPVEYFNPFRNVQIDPGVNLEELAQVAHSLGEVVGLSLRNLANCPVEMNLMPASTLRWRTFNEKKPYFVATVFSLVAVAFAVGFLFQKLAESKEDEIRGLEPQKLKLEVRFNNFDRAYRKMKAAQKEVEQITTLMEARYYWSDVLAALRRALIRAEDDIKKKLSAQRPGVEAGVWVEQMTFGAPPAQATVPGGYPGAPPSPSVYDGEGPGAPAVPAAGAETSPTNTLTLICRAVNLSNVDPSAATTIAYAVEGELKDTPCFDPNATALLGNVTADDVTRTITFGLTVGLTNMPNLNF